MPVSTRPAEPVSQSGAIDSAPATMEMDIEELKASLNFQSKLPTFSAPAKASDGPRLPPSGLSRPAPIPVPPPEHAPRRHLPPRAPTGRGVQASAPQASVALRADLRPSESPQSSAHRAAPPLQLPRREAPPAPRRRPAPPIAAPAPVRAAPAATNEGERRTLLLWGAVVVGACFVLGAGVVAFVMLRGEAPSSPKRVAPAVENAPEVPAAAAVVPPIEPQADAEGQGGPDAGALGAQEAADSGAGERADVAASPAPEPTKKSKKKRRRKARRTDGDPAPPPIIGTSPDQQQWN